MFSKVRARERTPPLDASDRCYVGSRSTRRYWILLLGLSRARSLKSVGYMIHGESQTARGQVGTSQRVSRQRFQRTFECKIWGIWFAQRTPHEGYEFTMTLWTALTEHPRGVGRVNVLRVRHG